MEEFYIGRVQFPDVSLPADLFHDKIKMNTEEISKGKSFKIVVSDKKYFFDHGNEKFINFVQDGDYYKTLELVLQTILGCDLSKYFYSDVSNGKLLYLHCLRISDL